jgi:hypothetical protein
MKKRFRSLLALGVLAPAALVAQGSTDSTAQSTVPASPLPFDFSSTVFGNYHYNAAQPGQPANNSFSLDRAYLTTKMLYRLKYGYLNYTMLKGANGAKVDGRVGVIQTPVIETLENYWPRYLSQTPLERAGIMSSADVGAAALVSLPNKVGELYLGVLNGSGYQIPTDQDRFKDYTARLSLTPFGSSDMWLLKNMTLLGYYYKGTTDGSITGDSVGMKRDAYGAFLGLKDPRFTFGAEWDQTKNGTQTAITPPPTTGNTYTEGDITGRLWSVFGTAKPFQMMDANGLPLGIVLRYDNVKSNTDLDGSSRYFVGGLTWDLSKRIQFAVDYQEQVQHDGFASGSSTLDTPAHTWYAHWVANF